MVSRAHNEKANQRKKESIREACDDHPVPKVATSLEETTSRYLVSGNENLGFGNG